MEFYRGTTVLITGASSGFGEEFARQLAPHATRLILAARRIDHLNHLKQELTAKHPGLEIINHQIDLSNPGARDVFYRELMNAESIDVLVNNAGLGDLGRFQSADWIRIHAMLEVNIAALTTLTHAVLPGMKKRGRGSVLNVSSLSSIFPIPHLAVYAATKAYVGSFSESLRAELRGSGITVTSVCPGPVDTEFGRVASRKNSRDFPVPDWIKIPTAQVVSDALLATARDQARTFPGFAVKVFALAVSLTPLPILRRLLPLYAK